MRFRVGDKVKVKKNAISYPCHRGKIITIKVFEYSFVIGDIINEESNVDVTYRFAVGILELHYENSIFDKI